MGHKQAWAGQTGFPPRFAPDSEPVIKERGARAMHAIIETGGKRYKVAEGDVLFIEKLPQEAGDAIKFDKVLAILATRPSSAPPWWKALPWTPPW